MSESPNVLIAVGNTTEGGIIPQQNYKNIFTEFNIASINTESDAVISRLNRPLLLVEVPVPLF